MANFQFVLLIDEVGGELELSLESENPAGTQRARRLGNSNHPGRGPRKNGVKREKHNRRQENQREPDLSCAPHLPIILIDRGGDVDTVVWKCQNSFQVDFEFDEGFLAPGDTPPPRSPMTNVDTGNAFSGPQQSCPGTGQFAGFQVVQGRYTPPNGNPGTDVANFLFYKCTVWSNGLKLDPDFYCDR